MSLLGSIVSKILHPFGGGDAQAKPADAPASTGGAVAAGSVDVEQVLNGMAAKNGQTLNWRTSIVDLMKLLDLDSSLTARKQLADELHYTGDKEDSASMNVWLHKQVIKKLEENGGKVPADLKDRFFGTFGAPQRLSRRRGPVARVAAGPFAVGGSDRLFCPCRTQARTVRAAWMLCRSWAKAFASLCGYLHRVESGTGRRA